MEASSPLAAMRQAPTSFGMPLWGRNDNYSDIYSSYQASPKVPTHFGPGSFNFRNMAKRQARPEYFTLDTVRDSSPTTSLAADLSQNFHIDKRYVPLHSFLDLANIESL